MSTLPKPDDDISVEPMGYMELVEEYLVLEVENNALLTLVPVLEQIANYPFGGHTPPEMRKLASEALATLPKHLRSIK